jgi:hypothetical protein
MDFRVNLIGLFAILAVVAIAVTILLIRKKDQTKLPTTETGKESYKFITCERCKKRNWVDENNPRKICSTCGWNLSEPYIHTSFLLSEGPDLDGAAAAELQTNDPLFIRYQPAQEDGLPFFAIYNDKNEYVGRIPESVAGELGPKLQESIRVFGKVKQKTGATLEVLVTNDVQKMWG